MRHLPHLFAALILTLLASAAQAEIHWETNLRAAQTQAQQDGKLLLLHFYSDNCVWCDRLDAGAFQAAEVAEAIHRHYVPVKIHAGQNPNVAQTFRVNRFPTDVIVTPEGTALAHRTSPQEIDGYIAMLSQHIPTAGEATTLAHDASAADASPQASAAPQIGTAPDASAYAMPEIESAVAAQQAAASGYQAPTEHQAVGELAEMPSNGTPVNAVSHRNPVDAATPSSLKATPPKLALDGYCAVSISEKSEWLEGNPELGVIHLGNLYLFVDEVAMEKFLANPEPYTPVLNGIDVVRFFEEKKIVPGKRDFGVKDPDYNRMFFFSDEAAMIHFENQHNRYTDAAITVTRQAVADANPRR